MIGISNKSSWQARVHEDCLFYLFPLVVLYLLLVLLVQSSLFRATDHLSKLNIHAAEGHRGLASQAQHQICPTKSC